MKKLKWTTVSEYVDINTGEQLSKTQANRDYVIIRKTKKTKLNDYKFGDTTLTEGIVTITNECTRNGSQIKLF